LLGRLKNRHISVESTQCTYFLEYPQQFTFRTYKYKKDSSSGLGNQ